MIIVLSSFQYLTVQRGLADFLANFFRSTGMKIVFGAYLGVRSNGLTRLYNLK